MSAESWEKEYMPVPVEELRTMDEMCKAVRKKWEGAKEENRRRHEVIKGPRAFMHDLATKTRYKLLFSFDPKNVIDMGGRSCAWCHAAKEPRGWTICDWCPAVRAGMTPCNSAWKKWAYNNDPQPMIDWVDLAIHAMAPLEE